MAQTAAHLIDNVMPRVPVRQVVLSVPKRIRWFLHRDPKVLGGVLRVFLRALRTTMRKHSPQAPPDAQIGAVSFSHRAGSSLNVHPHFHGAVCDGVFAENSEGEAVFYPATELRGLAKIILTYRGDCATIIACWAKENNLWC